MVIFRAWRDFFFPNPFCAFLISFLIIDKQFPPFCLSHLCVGGCGCGCACACAFLSLSLSRPPPPTHPLPLPLLCLSCVSLFFSVQPIFGADQGREFAIGGGGRMGSGGWGGGGGGGGTLLKLATASGGVPAAP
jgi:hypothetical protein